jgi:glycosyltransferase involved in cell wall biosynthesis
MQMKIRWIVKSPSPYNDFLFDSLTKKLKTELLVHYDQFNQTIYPWKKTRTKHYSYVISKKHIGIDFKLLKYALTENKTLFVIGGWGEVNNILLLSILLITAKPFVVWTDAPNVNKHRKHIKEYFRGKWLKIVFKGAYKVMGTGQLAKTNLLLIGCPENKFIDFSYITNIDEFSFKQKPPKAPEKQIVFISSGRLVNSHKGYDLALKALAQLKYKFNINNFTYKLAGTGPDLDLLKQLSVTLGIEANVDFLGWLEVDQLPEFYKSADFFLHPAIFEPYGVCVLEAMASGTVVIGSNQTGAILDRVKHNISGYIHESENIYSLTETIVMAVGNIDNNNKIASTARLEVERKNIDNACVLISSILTSI